MKIRSSNPWAIVILTLCLIVSTVSPCPSAADEAEAWVASTQAGAQALREGRLADAETLLLYALDEADRVGSKSPMIAATLNNLASVRHHQGRYDEARVLYERAIEA